MCSLVGIYQLLKRKNLIYHSQHLILQNQKFIIKLQYAKRTQKFIGISYKPSIWTIYYRYWKIINKNCKFVNCCVVNRRYYKLRGGGRCYDNSTGPPCFG